MGEQKKKALVVGVLIVVISLGVGVVCVNIRDSFSAYKKKILEYNEAVENYNAVAEEYEKIKLITYLESIEGLPEIVEDKMCLEEDISLLNFITSNNLQNTIVQDTEIVVEEMNEVLYAIVLAQQITNPDEKWVIERLQFIDDITEMKAVTERQDPNQLLGIEGGYTSCIYFSVNQIDQSLVNGADIVEKGTDAGGAIEVYATIADARNRCEYLGQFDDTLLYSGSYAILGTIVIRTSYLLTNEQQTELTNKITSEFTALK